MRHVFIINPAAGQGKTLQLIKEIKAVCSVAGVCFEIYETTGIGDGEQYVRSVCEAHAEGHLLEEGQIDDAADKSLAESSPGASASEEPETESLRFYACGGDGTLNEVVNGAVGFGFAEVGCIPAGTGNDFIRNFPGGRFDDLIAQIRGEASLCDLIHYEGICDGKETARYCVNMFNIGFDCNVVDMTAQMKQKPLMSGSLAYLASVAAMLIRKEGADLRVEYAPASADTLAAAGEAEQGTDEDADPAAAGVGAVRPPGFVYDGKLLLIAVANGCYCGGGVKGIPRSVTDDGFFDVSLVKDVPRSTFIKLFPKYMKGTHLDDPRLENVIRYTHEETLLITPNKRGERNEEAATMKLCVDGEITEAGPVRFTISPNAFRFVVPR